MNTDCGYIQGLETTLADLDVILLREDESATGYRTLYFDDQSILRPEVVSWQYHHEDARWVFSAVYALPEPGKPGSPNHVEVPRPECRIPDDLPEPLAVRPLAESVMWDTCLDVRTSHVRLGGVVVSPSATKQPSRSQRSTSGYDFETRPR